MAQLRSPAYMYIVQYGAVPYSTYLYVYRNDRWCMVMAAFLKSTMKQLIKTKVGIVMYQLIALLSFLGRR